jgi:ribose transport system substrate-binding protein
MRKITLSLVVLAIAATAVTFPGGCRKADKRPKIALIMKALNNEFFKTMEDGAKAHQKANSDKYELLSTGISVETDVEKQTALVDQMIAQRVHAIVLTPADSKQLVIPAKRALDAGIVVVNIDNKLDAATLDAVKAKIPFVGPDNAKGARKGADYLATKLKKGDKVVIIDGMPGTYNAEQRHKGFEQSMREAGMNLLPSQSAKWDTAEAERIVGSILPGNRDLKAILCANDLMAEGAVSAVKAAGMEGKILIVGFDNTTAAQELIKAGKMLATADQHADRQAVWGIEYALEILEKKSTPQDRETEVDLITAESLRK